MLLAVIIRSTMIQPSPPRRAMAGRRPDGPRTTALLLALTASHYSKKCAMVGLEFWVRFRRAIYANETIRLEWLVIKVTPNEK
jgi:hypothetical protein